MQAQLLRHADTVAPLIPSLLGHSAERLIQELEARSSLPRQNLELFSPLKMVRSLFAVDAASAPEHKLEVVAERVRDQDAYAGKETGYLRRQTLHRANGIIEAAARRVSAREGPFLSSKHGASWRTSLLQETAVLLGTIEGAVLEVRAMLCITHGLSRSPATAGAPSPLLFHERTRPQLEGKIGELHGHALQLDAELAAIAAQLGTEIVDRGRGASSVERFSRRSNAPPPVHRSMIEDFFLLKLAI